MIWPIAVAACIFGSYGHDRPEFGGRMTRAGMHGRVVDGRRAGYVAAAAVAVGCVLPEAAGAFTATAETVPGKITYFGVNDPRTTRDIEQRLIVRAGPADEHLLLIVRLEDGQVSPGPLRIEGGGALGAPQLRAAISASSLTGGRGGCEQPTVSERTFHYDLRLPAGTRTIVSYAGRVRLTRAPASPALFVQKWQLAPAPAGASSGAVTIASKPVKLAGLRAARVSMRVAVAGSGRSIEDGGRLVVRSRTSLAVGGYVARAHQGDAVTIWRFAPGAKSAAPLARARIDRHGRFSYAWRPLRRGTWDLYATYAGHRGLVEPARSPCGGPQVRVTRDVSARRLSASA